MEGKKNQNKKVIRILVAILCVSILFLIFPTGLGVKTGLVQTTQAATKINVTKKTLAVGMTAQLKVTGTSKKITWSSSNKKVVSVNSKGKIRALKKGTATIRARVGQKTLSCKVTVKRNYCKFSGQVARKTGYYDVSQSGGLIPSINIMPIDMEYLSNGSLKVKYMLWNFSTVNWTKISVLNNAYIKTNGGSLLLNEKTIKLKNPFALKPDDSVYLTITYKPSQVKKVVNLNNLKGMKYKIDIYLRSEWAN